MKSLSTINKLLIIPLFALMSISIYALPNEANITIPTMEDCPSPKWGIDSLKTVESLSLYKQFYKQKNYTEALKTWRYVFTNAAGSVEYALIDGGVMYKTIIRDEKDKVKRAPFIDTLMMIYDRRLACFGETGNVLARKASDMVSLMPKERVAANELFKRAFDLDGTKSSYQVMYSYIFNTIQLQLKGKIDTTEVIENYNTALSILDANAKDPKNAKKLEKIKSTQGKIDDVISPFLKCETLMPLVNKQYSETPDDQALWQKIYSQMKTAGCINEPIFLEVAIKLQEVDPNATRAFFIAKKLSFDKKFEESISYYKEAIRLQEDGEKRGEYELDLAKVYRATNQYSTARTFAIQAAKNKTNWGEPYILIGDLYASSGPICGPGTGWDSQIVVWPAIDKYAYAKSIDPSIADKANSRIGRYSGFMPSSEDCFMRSFKDGDAITVGCWINETTKVRSLKQ